MLTFSRLRAHMNISNCGRAEVITAAHRGVLLKACVALGLEEALKHSVVACQHPQTEML